MLKKLNAELTKNEIDAVINCQSGAIEEVLRKVYSKLDNNEEKSHLNNFNKIIIIKIAFKHDPVF